MMMNNIAVITPTNVVELGDGGQGVDDGEPEMRALLNRIPAQPQRLQVPQRLPQMFKIKIIIKINEYNEY